VISAPNGLSLLRIVLVAAIWIPALAGRNVWVAIGIAIAGATDVADGMIARRTHRTTALGSQLDSIADFALMGSTLAWLFMLRPEFFHTHRVPLLIWLGAGLLTLAIGWLRFRRFGDLHLYSAKFAGTMAYLFAIYLLVAGTYSPIAFYLVLCAASVGVLESLLIFLLADDLRQVRGAGSILPLIRRGTRRPFGPV
jgi:phosphatidylglycerophosphate synthase